MSFNTLYYGSGKCSIEANDVIAIDIWYKGAIKIIDKTPKDYYISHNETRMLIFPTREAVALDELFNYIGNLTIQSAMGANSNFDAVNLKIRESAHYSELINSNAEDLTVKSEDLNIGRTHGGVIKQTINSNNIIKRLNTTDEGVVLYNKFGKPYDGDFHVHLNGTIMSLGEHSGRSQPLFIKKLRVEERRPDPKGRVRKRKKRGANIKSRGGY